MQKECEICGVWFEAVRSDRKYCDKCQKNSGKAEGYIKRAIVYSKNRLDEDYNPVDLECPICGKTFTVPKKFRSRDYLCCSYECREKYKEIEKAERAAERQAKLDLLPTIKCMQCGKEFKAKPDRKFCSQACSIEYSRENAPRTLERAQGDIERTCKVCGKKFMVHKDKPTPIKYLAKCCSQECKNVLAKKGIYKSNAMREEMAKKYEEQRRQKEYAANGLCAYCRTSYKDCERMQSNFRIIPKGARFNNNGKIIECPKFKR